MSKGFIDRGYENGLGNVLESDAPNFEISVRALAEGIPFPPQSDPAGQQ